MKSNPAHQWKITLRGKSRAKSFLFFGPLDAALAAADERESEVPFVVVKFIVTRGRRVSPASVSSVCSVGTS
jgi:hypothetical protein